jgi:hypothetical protein
VCRFLFVAEHSNCVGDHWDQTSHHNR